MMHIVYFSDKVQILEEVKKRPGNKVIITPSPARADGIRALISGESTVDVITISKFTSNLIKTLWQDTSGVPELKRKSELLLIFGILRSKYFPKIGFEQFQLAYSLFSDLRSYSLDLQALTAILDEQPQEIAQAIQMFWKVIETMGVVDEHGAFQMISERLREQEEMLELKNTFIFFGFQHLNAQQVDLIKSLAIRYNVIIPFPFSLKNELRSSDWISWLQDSKTILLNLPVLEKKPKAQWLVVNSREISKNLKKVLIPNVATEVILGVSKLNHHHVDLIPSGHVDFKINGEILKNEISLLNDLLLANIPVDFNEWFKDQKQKSIMVQDYKILKVIQLYEEAYNSISAITDDFPKIDVFFIKLLAIVVKLNQPRTSYIPLSISNLNIELKDMASLENVDRSKKIILCIDDRFDDFQGLGQTYSEPIQKVLNSLGPIKRNELDLKFKEWEITDIFSKSEVLVLMPESVLKHSLVWKKVFSPVELIKMNPPNENEVKIVKDVLKDKIDKSFNSNLSASKLQSYVDCPRKFYFNYVEKSFPDLKLHKDIDNKVSGILVHKIIDCYFKQKSALEDIPKLAREVLTNEIKTSMLELPYDVFSERLLTLTHRSFNGINLLQKMAELSGQKIDWKIEEGFEFSEKYQMKGSIDCIGESDTHLWLLDFKSTDASASTNTEIKNFSSLQLWVYSMAAQKIRPGFDHKKIALGYVVLDEPSKSNIFFEDEELLKTIKEAKICSPTSWGGDFRELMVKAKEVIDSTAEAMFGDCTFPIKPRTSDACLYCEISSVCIKQEDPHVRT